MKRKHWLENAFKVIKWDPIRIVYSESCPAKAHLLHFLKYHTSLSWGQGTFTASGNISA